MRIKTSTGLTGWVIGYVQTNCDSLGREGVAIIERDDAPFPNRSYSTHRLCYWVADQGSVTASSGFYDLTLEEARASLRHRAGGLS